MTWFYLSVGIIYDLFECLAGQMEMNGLTTVPLFFLSPVADRWITWQGSRVRIWLLSQWKNSEDRVTVYTVKSRGREGNLHLRPNPRYSRSDYSFLSKGSDSDPTYDIFKHIWKLQY